MTGFSLPFGSFFLIFKLSRNENEGENSVEEKYLEEFLAARGRKR